MCIVSILGNGSELFRIQVWYFDHLSENKTLVNIYDLRVDPKVNQEVAHREPSLDKSARRK